MTYARRDPPTAALATAHGGAAPLTRIFLLALAIRVMVAFFLQYVIGNDDLFGPDHIGYHNYGRLIASVWSGDNPNSLGTVMRMSGPRGYYYIVGALYFLFGPYAIVVKTLNCVAGAIAVLLVHDITARMGGGKAAALRAARYVAFFPSLVLWSALNLRDAWVVLAILLVARQAMLLQAELRLRTLVLLFLSTLALVQFRAYVLLPVTAPVVLSLLAQRSRNLERSLVLGSLAALALIYVDQAAGANRALRVIDFQELQQQREWNAQGGSKFERVDISSPAKALVFLPKGLALFLLAPFPWMLGSVRQIMALPEMLLFYWLLPSIFVGIRYLLKHEFRRSLLAALITAGLTFGYALGEGNAGTAYRHRAQILCFFLAFAAVGVEVRRSTGTLDESS